MSLANLTIFIEVEVARSRNIGSGFHYSRIFDNSSLILSSQRANNCSFCSGVSRSTIAQEETAEAQRKLVKGNQVYVTAPVFLVYRDTAARLRKACQLLANSFGTAKVKREKSVCWALWL